MLKTPSPGMRPVLRVALFAALAIALTAGIGVSVYASGLVGGPRSQVLAKMAAEQTAEARAPRNTTKHPGTPVASCPHAAVTSQVLPLGYAATDFDQYIKNSAVATPVEKMPFYYGIYGGARKNNMQQGLIIVMRMDLDPCLPSAAGNKVTYYDTPYQDGAVTLTQLQGDTILFTTTDGKSGSLNFVTGTFA